MCPLFCCALLLTDALCSPDSNEFSRLVAGEYLSFFDFSGLTLDRALRSVGLGWGCAHKGGSPTSAYSCQLYYKLVVQPWASLSSPLGRLWERSLGTAAVQ